MRADIHDSVGFTISSIFNLKKNRYFRCRVVFHKAVPYLPVTTVVAVGRITVVYLEQKRMICLILQNV